MKKDTIVLFDIDDVLFDTQHFIETNLEEFRLYEDAEAVLKKIAPFAEIGILSQGEYDFQLKKLIQTGIRHEIVSEHMHIVPAKDQTMVKVLEKYRINSKRVFFIDDRLNGLYHTKMILPQITTILLKRGRYIDNQEEINDFKPDRIIHKLEEIIDIIKGE